MYHFVCCSSHVLLASISWRLLRSLAYFLSPIRLSSLSHTAVYTNCLCVASDSASTSQKRKASSPLSVTLTMPTPFVALFQLRRILGGSMCAAAYLYTSCWEHARENMPCPGHVYHAAANSKIRTGSFPLRRPVNDPTGRWR